MLLTQALDQTSRPPSNHSLPLECYWPMAGQFPWLKLPPSHSRRQGDRGHHRRRLSHQDMPVGSFSPEDPVGLPLLGLHPGFCAVLPRSCSPPSSLSSSFLPEAADLLGTQRLSGYAAGAGVMAAVSKEQPQRPNAQRQAPGRRDQRAL